MPDSSDPFDDDAFFSDIDITALEEVEAHAISATQAVRPPPQLFKEPRPINTEPRAGGKSTFGFGELGKHTHPANETRYIDNVEKRKQYWGLKRDDDEEDGFPTVTIDATGRYDLARDTDDEDSVVDTHAPGGRGVAYTRTAALQHSNTTSAVAGPSRPPPPPAASMARVLARSASVGKQVFTPHAGRLQPGLTPISSQSSSQRPPSSQGSQARRSVLQLDDEKRKREELEREVERLQAQLQATKAQKRHWTDGLQVDMGTGDPEDRVRDLQTQVWKAKGEVETIRRLQKTDSEKHLAEAAQLRTNIAELDRQIAEKEKEAAARVESVKSQAIFATHAAFNSASRARKPLGPITGSPSRRQRGQTIEATSPRKLEPRETARFGGLHNGFAATPQLRQPTDSPKSEPVDVELPSPHRHEEMIANDWGEQLQLVHHVFHYCGTARIIGDVWTEPLLNRLLRFQPESMVGDFVAASARLLQASSEMQAPVQQVSRQIVDSLSVFLDVISRSIIGCSQPHRSLIGALVNVLDLVSSTLYLFPTYFDGIDSRLMDHLKSLVQHFYAVSNLGRRQVELQKLSLDYQVMVADQIIRVCEALSWSSIPSVWSDDTLVVIIIMLSDPKHGFQIVRRAFDLLRAASSKPGNFRALVNSSDAARADDHRKSRIDLPLVERASKYLATPLPRCGRLETSDLNVTIMSAITMMSLANPDAPVLLSERSSLVPALIILIHRESARFLGMACGEDLLQALTMSLTLLHHLVYPPPLLSLNGPGKTMSQAGANPFTSATQEPSPQGVDLQARLLTASSVKEFSGLQHIFVAALGSVAYCEPGGRSYRRIEDGLESGGSRMSVAWRAIQCLSQDLLEAVVEGPEADEIYEMYYSGDTGGRKVSMAMEEDEDEDEEGYAAMRDTAVIEID